MWNGKQIREYMLLEPLGVGGFCEVWKAEDQRSNRLVAIKFLKPEALPDPTSQQRLENEAKRYKELTHPNIIKAIDFFEEGGRRFLVLPYIAGGSLAKLMSSRQGPLAVQLVADLSKQILSALEYAHGLQIVHRDLKSLNILLDQGLRPVLIDFGIALAFRVHRVTQDARRLGTSEYMSPEQIRDPWRVGGRSDLYSLGVLLYEMLTGRLPFEATGDNADLVLMQKHLNELPRPLRELNPGIPPALEQAVLRALEKDPDRRFQSAAEMAAALSGAWAEPPDPLTRSQGRPPVPPPPPRPPSPPPRPIVPPAFKPPHLRAEAPQPPEAPKRRKMAMVVLALLALGVGGWRLYDSFSGHPDPKPIELLAAPGGLGASATPKSVAPATIPADLQSSPSSPPPSAPPPSASPQPGAEARRLPSPSPARACTIDIAETLPSTCPENDLFCHTCKQKFKMADGTGPGGK